MFSPPPPPTPDPLLIAQEKQAQTAQANQIQSSLSSDTLNVLRLFGQQSAMAGAGLTKPMTSMMSPK